MRWNILTGAAFLALLGIVAAIEQDKVGLLAGALLGVAALAAMGLGVHKMNKEGADHD